MLSDVVVLAEVVSPRLVLDVSVIVELVRVFDKSVPPPQAQHASSAAILSNT